MSRRMIDAAGFGREKYPFDDLFASLHIVNHCLADGFRDFLDFDRLLPSVNNYSWTPKAFADRYASGPIYAHHDMRLDENRARFRRRVERFLHLDASTAFVVIGEEPAVLNEELRLLRENLSRLIGDARLLTIAIGGEAPAWGCHGVTIAHVYPSAPHDGLDFAEAHINDQVAGLIRELAEQAALAA